MGRRGNGEGSISYHKKSGLYMARFTVETPMGPKRKAIYAKTRKEVSEKLSEALADRDKGLVFDGDREALGVYLERWLNDVVRDTVKENMLENYTYLVRRHIIPELGQVRLRDLKPDQVRRLYREKLDTGLSNRTVQLIHTTLRKALQQAVSDGILPRNVCEAVKAPRRVKKEMQTLSPTQARAFLKTAKGDRLEALYVLAISAGLREGELLGLRWGDVDLEQGKLRVLKQLTRTKNGLSFTEPKRGKTRVVRLTGTAGAALKVHKALQNEERLKAGSLWQDDDLVFTSTIGTPVDVGNLTYRSFRPLLKRAGLPRIRVHDLRHTAATLLLGKGVHPKIVQEMPGHSTITQTMDTYSHVLPDMQDEAVGAMEATLFRKG
jgi:integrase